MMVYFSVQNSFIAGGLYIPMGNNQSIKITSTQGSKPLYVALNYYVEQIA